MKIPVDKETVTNQKGFFLTPILLGILLFTGVVGGAYYVASNQSGQTSGEGTIFDFEKLANRVANISIQPSPSPSIQPATQSAYERIRARGLINGSPAPSASPGGIDYGFTKVLELPFVGMRALFPEGTVLKLNASSYMASKGEDNVHINIEKYDGGGRRAWFQKNHSGSYSFEAFSGKNNEGYIAYLKKPVSADVPVDYYYFTAISADKMLVVDGNNLKTGNNFFGSDLNKFKNFVSNIEITGLKQISTYGFKDLYRWSDNRKTVWEDLTLGLKVTVPEWVEFRNIKSQNLDGSYEYSNWERGYPEAKISNYDYLEMGFPTTRVDITNYFGEKSLMVFNSNFQNKEFNDLIYGILYPAGFCSTEWVQSKSLCSSPEYCYTREDVIQNLKLLQSEKIGVLQAQLRGLDATFSSNNDCRASDSWVVKARDGKFAVADFGPLEDDIIRLESSF